MPRPSAATFGLAMTIDYNPKSQLEKFGQKVFNLLVDNFPQTFYIGGMVRNILLGKKITDIDITTIATPDQVKKVLADGRILFSDQHQKFGVIAAKRGLLNVEIATFRKDLPNTGRYPKVVFVKTAKQDSQRRDFTVNALYFSPKTQNILDFHNGLKDIKFRRLKFIGNPEKRITEDPLRIIRALRFAQTLNLKLDVKTQAGIKRNFKLVNQLTKPRVKNELEKIQSQKHKNFIQTAIDKHHWLDTK